MDDYGKGWRQAAERESRDWKQVWHARAEDALKAAGRDPSDLNARARMAARLEGRAMPPGPERERHFRRWNVFFRRAGEPEEH